MYSIITVAAVAVMLLWSMKDGPIRILVTWLEVRHVALLVAISRLAVAGGAALALL
jgi:hypothetical protein